MFIKLAECHLQIDTDSCFKVSRKGTHNILSTFLLWVFFIYIVLARLIRRSSSIVLRFSGPLTVIRGLLCLNFRYLLD